MAPLVVPNAWQMKVMFHDADVEWSNLYGVDVGLIPVLSQALTDEAEAAVAAVWDANLKGLCPAEVVYDGIVMTDLRTEGGPQFTSPNSILGTGAGDRLPDQLAVCATIRTALRTRAGRGRSYISGFTEGQNTAAGRIAATAVTGVTDYLQDMWAALSGSSFTGDLGVISRKDPAFGTTGTIRPAVSIEVRDNVWDSQRRRRAGS